MGGPAPDRSMVRSLAVNGPVVKDENVEKRGGKVNNSEETTNLEDDSQETPDQQNDSQNTPDQQDDSQETAAEQAEVDKAPLQKEGKTSTGMQQNLAAMLSYLFGFITGIVFLVLEKENQFVRYHAFQSIFISVALTILNYVLVYIPIIGWLLYLVLWPVSLILWLLLMYKAYQGELYKLPVVGNMAAQQAGLESVEG